MLAFLVRLVHYVSQRGDIESSDTTEASMITLATKIDFSKFTIEEIENWCTGSAGLAVDADNSTVVTQ